MLQSCLRACRVPNGSYAGELYERFVLRFVSPTGERKTVSLRNGPTRVVSQRQSNGVLLVVCPLLDRDDTKSDARRNGYGNRIARWASYLSSSHTELGGSRKSSISPQRQLCSAGPSEGHMRNIHESPMSPKAEQREDVVVAASSCPALDCGSLVIDYRPADSVHLGHPEDWEFTCSRCGMAFTVPPSDLIFQSIPRRWLWANMFVA